MTADNRIKFEEEEEEDLNDWELIDDSYVN